MPKKGDRARHAEAARALVEQGMDDKAIAQRLGLSRPYVNELRRDPKGVAVAERRHRNAPRCIECGNRTNNTRKDTLRCGACENIVRRQRARAEHIAAIQRFAERYGRPPTAADFNPPHARAQGQHWRAERFYRDGDYPALSRVQGVFGSWSAGLRAAGFEPYASGRYPRAKDARHRGAHLQQDRRGP